MPRNKPSRVHIAWCDWTMSMVTETSIVVPSWPNNLDFRKAFWPSIIACWYQHLHKLLALIDDDRDGIYESREVWFDGGTLPIAPMISMDPTAVAMVGSTGAKGHSPSRIIY